MATCPFPKSPEEVLEDNVVGQPFNSCIFFEKPSHATLGNTFITFIGNSWNTASISQVFNCNKTDSYNGEKHFT
jgi:hypothetical protein